MTENKTRRCLALGAALGVAVLLTMGAMGCATTSQEAKARRLNTEEAEKLLSFQRARLDNPEVKVDPEADPKALEARGDAMALSGSWEAALFQYNRALSLADKAQRNRLRGKAAEIQLRARHFAQAEDLFASIVKDDPQNASAWQGLGLARISRGESQAAAEALGRALALRPDYWKAANALGIIRNHRHESKEALVLFTQALKSAPRVAEIYNNRGLAYLLCQQKELAEADFKRALQLKPDFTLASNNLALLMAKEGRLSEAFAAFSRSNGQARAHNNLGCWLAWQGDGQKAAEHFGQALRDMPRYYPLAGAHLEQVKSLGDSARPAPVAQDISPLGSRAISLPRQVEKPLVKPVEAKAVEKEARRSETKAVAAAEPPKVEPGPAPAAPKPAAKPPEPKPSPAKPAQPAVKDKTEALVEPKIQATAKPYRVVPEAAGPVPSEKRHLPAGMVVVKSEEKLVEGLWTPPKEGAPAVAGRISTPKPRPDEPVSRPPADVSAGSPLPGPGRDMGYSAGPALAESSVRFKARPDGSAGVWRGTIPAELLKDDLPQIALKQARPGMP